MINHNRYTTSYADVVTEIDEEWLRYAADSELAAAVKDLAKTDYLPKELQSLTLPATLNRFWLTYALIDSGTPYPTHNEPDDERSLEVYLACVCCDYAWGCDYNSDEDAALKVAYWRSYADC